MQYRQAVAYIRVSTQKQGRSGLGLAAQTSQIEAFCVREGITILHSFVEVESGKDDSNRPELHKAMQAAKALGCSVVVAKLDRLSRSVHFISGLMVNGVNFVVAQLGTNVSPFMLHVYAAFAEAEREAISTRTKAAMKEAKARGVKFGNPHWEKHLPAARAKSNEANRSRGDRSYWRVIPFLIEASKDCHRTTEFVRYLNENDCLTARGKAWSTGSLNRFLKRAKAEGFIPA